MKKNSIVYIHGFNSSGEASKSKILREAVKAHLPDVHYYSPTLVHDPLKAKQALEALLDPLAQTHRFCFVGSSLGGFYAIYLAHRYVDAKAVLINPAIRPFDTMASYCGDYENAVTGEKFSVTLDFIEDLREFYCEKIIDPKRFLLLLQKDDEVLDYHIAESAFPDSPKIIRTGGGHQCSDFDELVADVLQFSFADSSFHLQI